MAAADPTRANFASSVRATAHTFLERLDDAVLVAGDEGHHLRRVRRVRAGEMITGADGHGRWRTYEVAGTADAAVQLRATSGVHHEPRLTPLLTVACALTKGERPEWVVQKLTELGADSVVFVQASRSVVQWHDARRATARERLQRIAREAAAQSRRSRFPVIDGPVGMHELAARAGLVIADVEGSSADALALPPRGEWVVAVGPEGGFDDVELAALGTAPRLAIGPYVLRAETAAVAAAAALAGRRTVSAASADEREEW